MRIAIACCGLGHVARGIEAWAGETARLLHVEGIPVTLFKGGGKPETEYEIVIPCLRRNARLTRMLTGWTFRGAWRIPFRSPYGLESFTFARNIRKRLRQGYDVVHLQDPHVALRLQDYKRQGRIAPRVLFANGTEQSNDTLMRFDCLQELDSIGADALISLGRRRTGLYVAPNFVDCSLFKPGDRLSARRVLGIPAEAFVVLTVAAIERGFKRVDHLIHEVALLRGNSCRKVFLVVAGASTDETEGLKRTARDRLGEGFKFITDLSYSGMPEVYRAADMFAFCVTHGIFGIALAEAAATGLACVVHDAPRVKWVGGPRATVVDMLKSGELSAAIERLQAESLRTEISLATRRWAVENLDGRKVIRQYIAIYEDILRIPAERGGNSDGMTARAFVWADRRAATVPEQRENGKIQSP